MIDQIPVEELKWVTRFFAGSNHLKWSQILEESAPASWLVQVSPWLKFLCGSGPDRPIVLPLFGPEGPLVWYGMATNDEMAAQMREEVLSFVGPSYSDFSGGCCELETENEIEGGLSERFESRVIRFSPKVIEDKPEIERLLLLYQGILTRRPQRPDRSRRPFGKIRGDFDRALLAGNADGAGQFLDELLASGRVNAEQRKCLEIRLLAGLGRREELARNHMLIASVMDLTLPPQIIADLVAVLYETYITPIEINPDFDVVTATFKKNISRPFGRLFKERKGIRLPNVLRAFLLFELVQDEPNTTRCEAIIAAFHGDGRDRLLAQKWLECATRAKSSKIQFNVLERVRQAIIDEDYLVAVDLCFKELPNAWAYAPLLRCAVELNSIEVTRRVVEILDNADVTTRTQLTEKERLRWDLLQARLAESVLPRVDSSWLDWGQWVVSGVYHKPPMEVLDRAILSWSVDEYIHDVEQCKTLAILIGNASGHAEEVFREAFPYLVEFFVDRLAQPVRTFAPLYAMLVKVVALTGVVSADELELAMSLTQALLTIGPNREMYSDCLEDLCEIVAANNSPIHLDWALNTAEMLALYPTQNSELRLRFFMAVTSMAHVGGHRVSTTQRAVLEVLVKDYNCPMLLKSLPELDKDETTEKGNIPFKGVIGIYTLMESAGLRAKVLLEKLLLGATVELNGDTVATDRLTSLARNADVFVFAWRSSKHQAYYCVKEARKKLEIIMSPGKGTASIVKSVLDNIALNQ